MSGTDGGPAGGEGGDGSGSATGSAADPGVVETRGSTVGELPGRRRLVVAAVGSLFWTWLVARWAYHSVLLDGLLTPLGAPDVIRSERGLRARESWLPAGPFEAAADAVGGVATALGPAGVLVDWLRWILDLAAFATEVAPAMAAGAYFTVLLTLASMLLGLLIAVPLVVARVYGGPVLSNVALGYTELIRGTPLLAQLFLLYFGLPLASAIGDLGFVGEPPVPRAAVFVAIVGFTINSSAYQSEYIRSAVESVDPGQLRAARSVGLTRLQGVRHVVLPQGLRYAIPGWTNEFVYLIKYSSLAAFITVPELFRRARNIGSDTFQFTDIYAIVAVVYLALVLTTALGMSKLEAAVAIPGVGKSGE